MKARTLALLACAALGAPVVLHADPVPVDFLVSSRDSSQMFMTGEADGIMQMSSTWDAIGEDGGPLAGLKGPCFGSARLAAGRISGDGYCAYTDADNNTFLVRWWMEDAAMPMGAWAAAGGTGKWAKATGGGTFEDVPGEAAGTSKSHISGSIDFH
jgi:hypothetical protein